MSKLKELIQMLDSFEFNSADEEAVAERAAEVVAEVNDLEAKVEELEQQLLDSQNEVVVAEERAVSLESEADVASEKLASVVETMVRNTEEINSKLEEIESFRTEVTEKLGKVPVSEEAEVRTAEVQDETPLATNDEFVQARQKPHGSERLFRQIMERFKNRFGEIWDETYDGDPYRPQTVRLQQAGRRASERPKFVG